MLKELYTYLKIVSVEGVLSIFYLNENYNA